MGKNAKRRRENKVKFISQSKSYVGKISVDEAISKGGLCVLDYVLIETKKDGVIKIKPGDKVDMGNGVSIKLDEEGLEDFVNSSYKKSMVKKFYRQLNADEIEWLKSVSI